MVTVVLQISTESLNGSEIAVQIRTNKTDSNVRADLGDEPVKRYSSLSIFNGNLNQILVSDEL